MPSRLSRVRTWTVLAALAAAPLSAQTAIPPDTEPAETSDTLALMPARDRLSVPVSIDGKGPYNFIVDTGAERTVISKELATRLALKSAGMVTLHSMTGVNQVETAHISSLIVNKNPIIDIRAPALQAVNLGAPGILGTDTLEKQRVLLDFTNRKMKITTARRGVREDPDAIVVTARSRYGRLVVTNARAEGETITVIIDTGSDITIGNEALRAKLGKKKKLPLLIPVELTSVVGDKLIVDYTSLKRIVMGGITLENMPIAFHDVHPFKQLKLTDKPAILLGMDALALFDRVSIDFASKKVIFRPPDQAMRGEDTRLAAR